MSYAMRTRFNRESRAEKRPGSLLLGPGTPDDRRAGVLPSGGGAGLTEATSNVIAGDTVCAWTITPSSKPMAKGPASAYNPAAAMSAFAPPFRFFAALLAGSAAVARAGRRRGERRAH